MCLLSEHASSSCNWSFLPAPLCSTALFTFCSSTLQISSCTKIKPKSLPHFPVVCTTDHALRPSAPSLSFYDSALSWLDSLLVKCTFSPSWCKHQGSALDPSFSTLNSCSKICVVSRNVSKISHLKNAGNYISNVTLFFPPTLFSGQSHSKPSPVSTLFPFLSLRKQQHGIFLSLQRIVLDLSMKSKSQTLMTCMKLRNL